MSLIPPPIKRDITLIQGSDFPLSMRLVLGNQPAIWTGCRARWQLRHMPSTPEPLVALDSAAVDSTLTLDADGWINLIVPRATVIGLDFSEAVHYLEITWADGTTWSLIEGKATLRKGGCRP